MKIVCQADDSHERLGLFFFFCFFFLENKKQQK